MSLDWPQFAVAAVSQVRTDAADFMQHTTTSDLKARRMCRVDFYQLTRLLAWLDQHGPAKPDDGAGHSTASTTDAGQIPGSTT